MPKIDFDSDSAPFSGSILPTIEDVAALGDRVEKEIVDPIPRIDPNRATTVQRLLLPVTLCLVAGVGVGFHLIAQPTPAAQGAPPPQIRFFSPAEIPTTGARDIRIITREVDSALADMALRASSSARVTVVFQKDRPVSEKNKLLAAKVTLYPVGESTITSQGVLLDGLRWFSLKP
jgi:hypothetical protein